MDKQRLQRLAGVKLEEAKDPHIAVSDSAGAKRLRYLAGITEQFNDQRFHVHGEEVTEDNFEDVKKQMVQRIEDEFGPEGHDDLKQAMLSAASPQDLATVMVNAIKARQR